MKINVNAPQGEKQAGFVFKVLVLSAGFSMFIKYGGPFLLIPPTTTVVLLLVLLPSLLMAGILGWRFWQYQKLN